MRDSNNLPFIAKLLMHTLCMTLLIISMISFQTLASNPPLRQKPEPPAEPEFSLVHSPESLIFHPYDETQDYGDGTGPPSTGGGWTGGPIPHAGLDDETEEGDMASDDIHLLD